MTIPKFQQLNQTHVHLLLMSQPGVVNTPGALFHPRPWDLCTFPLVAPPAPRTFLESSTGFSAFSWPRGKKRKRERVSGAPLRYKWFSLIFWHPTPFLKYIFYSFQLKTCISVTLYSFQLVFLFNYQSKFICKASNKIC